MAKASEASVMSMESLTSHHAMLESIVGALEDKVKGLQKQVELENTHLITTRDRHDQMRSEWKTEQEVARQHLNQELEAERLALKTKWAEVEQAQKDLGDVAGDLKRLADAQTLFQQEKARLTDLSIAIEQDRVTAVTQLDEANQKVGESATRLADAIAKEQAATQQLAQAETLGQQSAQQLEQTNLAVEANKATLTRLEALQGEIDPKIALVTAKEETARAEAEKAEKLHAEAMQRIAESQQLESDLQGLAARLEAREQKLLELHIQLRQFSLELTAKAQQLKAQGAEVSTPPEVPPVESTSTAETVLAAVTPVTEVPPVA